MLSMQLGSTTLNESPRSGRYGISHNVEGRFCVADDEARKQRVERVGTDWSRVLAAMVVGRDRGDMIETDRPALCTATIAAR